MAVRFKFHFVFLFFLFFASASGIAQAISLSDQARASVLTCASGNEVYSLFGHTAIRIKDPQRNLDIVYNYGAFDFEAPNFILRFTKGDLQYFVTAEPFEEFAYQYVYEQRAVHEQVLRLTHAQTQQLFDRLTAVLYSEERFYTYKFIDRNCTNMSSDVINEILGKKALVKTSDTSMPYRNVLFPYFDGHFFEQLGTSLIFGTKVDQDARLLFLPVELQESLAVTIIDGAPISDAGKTILNFPPVEKKGPWWNSIYTYFGILLLVLLLNKKAVTATYLIILGLVGTFFCIAGFYSYHEELQYNYNALLINPILLAVAVLYLRKSSVWLRRLSWFCIACIGIYLIAISGKVYFMIVLPLVLCNLIILGRFVMRKKITVRGKKARY